MFLRSEGLMGLGLRLQLPFEYVYPQHKPGQHGLESMAQDLAPRLGGAPLVGTARVSGGGHDPQGSNWAHGSLGANP